MRCKPVLVSALLAASSILLTACGGTASSSSSISSPPAPAASNPNSPPAGGSQTGGSAGSGSTSGSNSGSGGSGGSGAGSGSGSGSGSGGTTQGGFAETKLSVPAAGSMLTADLNRDGRPDLVIYANSLEVLINGGSGTFHSALTANIPAPYTNLLQVAFADFNGDGIADLAACANQANGSGGAALIYLNDGTGKLIMSKVIPIPATCQGIAAGDANRDGKADVAVAYYTGTSSAPVNTIATSFGDGTGNFGSPVTQSSIVLAQTHDSTANPCQIAGATGSDFDQNGTLDLILFGTCQSDVINPGNVYLAAGDGSGHYSLTEITESNTSIYGSPYVKDIDGDGKPDFVYVNDQFGPHGSNNTDLMFALRNASGTFTVSRAASETAYAGSGSALRTGSPLGSGLAVIGFADFPCCTAASYGVKLIRAGAGDVL
ncbi:MAG TPA: VCBS repeat-containing protein, partial [Terriglobales bacterium]|nr:VCBS repeat-containing protein [Terriglobales bacterium]